MRSLGVLSISPCPLPSSTNQSGNPGASCCAVGRTSLSFVHRPLLSPPSTDGFNKDELSHHSNPPFPNLLPKSPTILVLDEQDVAQLVEKQAVRGQKHLRDLSSWGIGGPCNYFLEVSCPSQLVSAIRYCRDRSLPFLVLGRGSNCLFEDRGFSGLVVLNRLFDQSTIDVVEPGIYQVSSGYPFNRLGIRCSNDGFSGLEFAGGIPGTVGGATFMNAGADGQETGDVIESVEIVTTEGEVRVLGRSELVFGYRWSSFQEMADLAAITAVTFRLTPAATARVRQRSFLERRRKSQPIGERSAGSVFRNPSGLGITAGELIDLAGLKGFQVGGAKVSEVHANFFINFNNSTSKDMLTLIEFIKGRVDRMFGIELQEEIRYVPYSTV